MHSHEITLRLHCERCRRLFDVTFDSNQREPVTGYCTCGLYYQVGMQLTYQWVQPWTCGRCGCDIPIDIPHDFTTCTPRPQYQQTR